MQGLAKQLFEMHYLASKLIAQNFKAFYFKKSNYTEKIKRKNYGIQKDNKSRFFTQ